MTKVHSVKIIKLPPHPPAAPKYAPGCGPKGTTKRTGKPRAPTAELKAQPPKLRGRPPLAEYRVVLPSGYRIGGGTAAEAKQLALAATTAPRTVQVWNAPTATYITVDTFTPLPGPHSKKADVMPGWANGGGAL